MINFIIDEIDRSRLSFKNTTDFRNDCQAAPTFVFRNWQLERFFVLAQEKLDNLFNDISSISSFRWCATRGTRLRSMRPMLLRCGVINGDELLGYEARTDYYKEINS